jgi:hypothetical protein
VQWHAVPCRAVPCPVSVGGDRIDSRPVHVGFVVDKFALVEVTLSVFRFYLVNKFHQCPILVPQPLTVYNLRNIGSVVNTLKKHTVTRLRAGWMRERGLISDRSGDYIFHAACRTSGTLNLPSSCPKYTEGFLP